ncbi:CPBP family intramembrane metalloprotease [Salipiger sp. IMCC34102]|uniref:CPBP family intramembrane glutamic endopeptidase n=1 Tax=Salipiger sp. IMCC34102 TaxID=2510647 RepID=UPI00101D97B8|nr:type II CAAX endopeptidase family protein [Salipiger sp. IMCC34102]RYH01975.1 CPBP family intramembrane metalloprotease [Salipiger sp. IMCC34102]
MIWPDRYTLMSRFTAEARPAGGLGSVLVVLVAFEFAFWLMGLALLWIPASAVDSPWATTLDFAGFLLPAAAVLLAVRVMHGRGLRSLIGTPFRRPLVRAGVAVGIVLALQEPAMLWLDFQGDLTVRPVLSWALWLIPGLAAILLQSGTEELVYRGYLQQQLGARSARPLVWMVIPSVYFGLGHLYNGETLAEGTLWAIWATVLGLACADLTARTGSIGAAVGLHFANNVFASVVIDGEGAPSSGLALLLYPPEAPVELDPGFVALVTPFTVFDIGMTVLSVGVMWLAARVALRV